MRCPTIHQEAFCSSGQVSMPLLTICSYPGCHSPVPRGERYCERHKDTGEKRDAEAKARAAKKRELRRVQQAGNSNERGYTYRWKKLRDRFIAQHPYCEQCFKEGKIVMATDIDHIVPHKGDRSLLYDERNLQALCHECHSRKTATEDGGFGRKVAGMGAEKK